MLRVIAGLVLGAGVGAAATWGLLTVRQAPGETGPGVAAEAMSEVAAGVSTPGNLQGAPSGLVTAAATVYEAAELTLNADRVEAEIARAAGDDPSAARDLKLAAWLLRLTELAPDRALRIVRTLGLEERFAALAFHAWATADVEAALAELDTIADRALRRAAAVTVLDALGGGERALATVIEALSTDARDDLEVDLLARQVATDPGGALAQAAAQASPGVRYLAVERVVGEWVRRAPERAMAGAQALTDPTLRAAAIATALAEWVEVDPAAALGAMLALDAAELARNPDGTRLVEALAARLPDEVQAAADRFPPSLQAAARQYPMIALAERDPLDALNRIDAMPPGRTRDRLIGAVARSYARRDPDASLAWARALEPPSQSAMSAIIERVAETDFDRALDIALEEGQEGIISILVRTRHPNRVPGVLDRLNQQISAAGPRGRIIADTVIPSLLTTLAHEDPEGAIAWLLEDENDIDGNMIRAVADTLVVDDATAAAVAAYRMPAAMRQQWLAAAAEQLAGIDPEGAMRFIAPFSAEPGYEALSDMISERASARRTARPINLP